jgi:phosphatidylserine decarboxylase
MGFDSLTALLHGGLPKKTLTTCAGMLANVQTPAIKDYLIRRFIQTFNVNMQEALYEDPKHYQTFNAFFIRELKTGARSLSEATVVSPADGYISEIGRITEGKLLQAKQRYYTADALLGGNILLSAPFENGSFATVYLSPKDYHRVHMPVTGRLKTMIYLPGAIYSVKPTVVQSVPSLFARNERVVLYFETELGPMAMVMVGATIVGKIGIRGYGEWARGRRVVRIDYDSHAPENMFVKGCEVGYFKLGSTVILLFGKSAALTWGSDLKQGAPLKMGCALGQA